MTSGLRHVHSYEHLVHMLAKARQEQGVTLAQVAERMGGCYLQQVYNWLNGVEPRASRIVALADALGYDLALVPRDKTAPQTALSATLAAERPSAQGADGRGPETGTAGVTGERAREDA